MPVSHYRKFLQKNCATWQFCQLRANFMSAQVFLEKTVHHPSRHEEFILFADFERQIPKFVCIVRPSKKKMEILPLWWHLTNFDIDNILPRVTIWPKHPTLTLGIFVVDPHQQNYPTTFKLCFLTLYQFSSDIEQFLRIKVCAEKFVLYQISNSSASFHYNPQSKERNDRAFFHANFNPERFFNFVGGETLVFNKMPLTGTIYQIYGTHSSIVSKNEQCPLILLTLNG